MTVDAHSQATGNQADPTRSAPAQAAIQLRGCRQHNLKNLDLDIPLGQLTVITGPSGSGKSSLAFHTLYAEGQRRYVETFSPYVRQFFDRMDRPEVDRIEGIPPAIAIEQKNHVRTTRSTVGTLTEIQDYLKILFARLADGFDPETNEVIRPDSAETAAQWAWSHHAGASLLVLFPLALPTTVPLGEVLPMLHQQGFLRVWLGSTTHRTDEPLPESYRPGPGVDIQVVQDRVTLDEANRSRLQEALEAAFRLGKGRAEVVVLPRGDDANPPISKRFSTAWQHPVTGFTLRPPTPGLFSFNSPLGACPQCRGFGRVIGIDLEKTVPDPSLSLADGAIRPFQGERGEECQRDLLRCCREIGLPTRVPWTDLTPQQREWIFYGEAKPRPHASAADHLEQLDTLWREGRWYGVKGFFDWLETKSYKMHVRVFLSRYRSYTTCNTCRGGRLQPEALCFRIDGKTLPDLWSMPISSLLPWFTERRDSLWKQPLTHTPGLQLVVDEIISRLGYLDQVGLGYLSLDRQTRTLSGGEVERVNLTTCLGAALTGTLFVLDEPTVGLHPRDINRLVGVMHGLRDKGNTLVVVEHERAVMLAADHLIDLGPGSGHTGGELLQQGPPSHFITGKSPRPDLGTAPWLSGARRITPPASRRKPGKERLVIRAAHRHNLQHFDAEIPLGCFVCVTGVSGSGKSTFVHDVLHANLARTFGSESESDPAPLRSLTGHQHLDGVERVDQTSVARTPRSTPALFVGAFDLIRTWFAESPEAKAAGRTAGFFSFNSGDGRCDRCAGTGSEKVEMQFLSDLYVTCPDCQGRRYKPSTLEFRLDGHSIADVLDLTAEAAVAWFRGQPAPTPAARKRLDAICQSLQPLLDVGLGYLRLGQPLNTLSGGESQRLKLCELLASCQRDPQARGKLLILDEPTTGLHFADIAHLLGVLQRLVDAGHSLVVVEHNVDVIQCADWIIDLGPEAGAAGGKVVATGTPEAIAACDSPTGLVLREALGKPPSPRAESQAKPRRKRLPNPDAAVAKPAAASECITLRGARHHNLKDVSLDIPRGTFVVISGLSGSGKSTLAFDILFAEGQRRFLDSMSAYARQFAEQLEKPEIDQLHGLPPTVAIEQRVSQGGGKSTVATITELWNFIRLLHAKLGTAYCPSCEVPVQKQSVSAIHQAVLKALGGGRLRILAPLVRSRKGYHTEVAEWAAKQGFSELLVDGKTMPTASFTRLARFKEHDIDAVVWDSAADPSATSKAPRTGRKAPTPTLPEAALNRALEVGKGTIRLLDDTGRCEVLSTHSGCPRCGTSFEEPDPRWFSFNSPHGWCPSCRGHGRVPGRRQELDLSRFDSVLEAEIEADRAIERMDDAALVLCPDCQGSRLNPVSRGVRIHPGGELTTPAPTIAELARLSIDHARNHFEQLTFPTPREQLISRDILPEIRQRLAFLQEVGLGYLQLDRSGNTLSGGEAQRIRLAAQLGSNLRGVLYVLDEPTIGLHPRDHTALLRTLISLKHHGNSVLVVEHDEETIAAADTLIDLGPGAGRLGGEVVYQGPPPALPNPNTPPAPLPEGCLSPTLRAFAHATRHPMRGSRRAIPADHPRLQVLGCHANNLKDVDAAIPLARLTVLTGISGSGKSTLMHACIARAAQAAQAAASKKGPTKPAEPLPFRSALGFAESLKACHEVDQAPIGKTSRSCPATYVKVFDLIREWFAQLPEARMRGFDASRFSFNTESGRCPDCKGNGRMKLEMDFLPPTWVHCESCNGARYNQATLTVTFRGKSIADVLAMTIDEAATFFAAQPRIAKPLQLMSDTGLGYLQLGQPSPTLSGGEAQRIKLVAELIKGRSSASQLRGANLRKGNLYLIEEPTVGLHLEDIHRLIDVLHRLVDEGHTVVVIEHHMALAAEADWIIDLGPEAGAGGGEIVAQGTPEHVAKHRHSRTAPFLAPLLAKPKRPRSPVS